MLRNMCVSVLKIEEFRNYGGHLKVRRQPASSEFRKLFKFHYNMYFGSLKMFFFHIAGTRSSRIFCNGLQREQQPKKKFSALELRDFFSSPFKTLKSLSPCS